jgi:hypothetical protein
MSQARTKSEKCIKRYKEIAQVSNCIDASVSLKWPYLLQCQGISALIIPLKTYHISKLVGQPWLLTHRKGCEDRPEPIITQHGERRCCVAWSLWCGIPPGKLSPAIGKQMVFSGDQEEWCLSGEWSLSQNLNKNSTEQCMGRGADPQSSLRPGSRDPSLLISTSQCLGETHRSTMGIVISASMRSDHQNLLFIHSFIHSVAI